MTHVYFLSRTAIGPLQHALEYVNEVEREVQLEFNLNHGPDKNSQLLLV